MSTAEVKNSEELTLSTNSGSAGDLEAESEIFTRKKSTNKKNRRIYARTVQVPKKYFHKVYKRAISGRSIVPNQNRSEAKRQCDRHISSELHCTQNVVDGISPDSITKLMCEMRNCLLRQDWFNLARLISMYTEMPLGKTRWYPTVLKFCLIALLHDPVARNTDLLHNFLEGVIGCQDKGEKDAFLNNIKDLPDNIHATKFADLWKTEIKSEDNFLNKSSLQKFNNLLSRKMDSHCKQNIEDSRSKDVGNDDHKSDDAGWETTDESDGDDDDDADKILDLNSILMEIESDYTETESIASFRK